MDKYFSFQRFAGLTLHYLYTMKRNPTRLIEILVWPSLELVLFSFLASAISSVDNVSIRVGLGILSGVVFWNFFARIIQETIAQFLDDAFSKNIQNLLITPLTLSEIVMSLFFSSLIKMSLSFIFLSLFLVFFYPLFFASVGTQVITWVALLVLWGCVLSLTALSLVFLFGERMSFIGWFLSTVIQIFSCVFYDRSVLPPLFYYISFLVPSSYVFQTMRVYLATGSIVKSQLVVALMLIVLYFLVSVILFQLSFHYAKKLGTLTKT